MHRALNVCHHFRRVLRRAQPVQLQHLAGRAHGHVQHTDGIELRGQHAGVDARRVEGVQVRRGLAPVGARGVRAGLCSCSCGRARGRGLGGGCCRCTWRSRTAFCLARLAQTRPGRLQARAPGAGRSCAGSRHRGGSGRAGRSFWHGRMENRSKGRTNHARQGALCCRCSALHSTAQHSTAQHSTAQHGTARHPPVCLVPGTLHWNFWRASGFSPEATGLFCIHLLSTGRSGAPAV